MHRPEKVEFIVPDNAFTPAQMEQLLQYASRRLGTTPEQLKQAFQQKGLAGLSSAMSAEEASRAEEFIHDRDKAARLLNDPQIQQMLLRMLQSP